MRIYPYAMYLNISNVVLFPHWTGAKTPPHTLRINWRCIKVYYVCKRFVVYTSLILFLETIIIICLAHLWCQPVFI